MRDSDLQDSEMSSQRSHEGNKKSKAPDDVSQQHMLIHTGSWNDGASLHFEEVKHQDDLAEAGDNELETAVIGKGRFQTSTTSKLDNPRSEHLRKNLREALGDSSDKLPSNERADCRCEQSKTQSCSLPFCRWYLQSAGEEPFGPLSHYPASQGSLIKHPIKMRKEKTTQEHTETNLSSIEGEGQELHT